MANQVIKILQVWDFNSTFDTLPSSLLKVTPVYTAGCTQLSHHGFTQIHVIYYKFKPIFLLKEE